MLFLVVFFCMDGCMQTHLLKEFSTAYYESLMSNTYNCIRALKSIFSVININMCAKEKEGNTEKRLKKPKKKKITIIKYIF